MRGLSLTLAIVLSTAVSSERVAAQQKHPTPPPQQPPASTPPPTILPYPPLMPLVAGGFTPGVAFPAKDSPVYSPNRPLRGRGYGGAYGGGYYGGYYGDTQPVPAAPSAAVEATGMLRLTGTPSAAEVFVDGYYVGTINDIEAERVLTLPAGPHRVELRAADYTPTTFDVRIDPHETLTYRAALDHVRPQSLAPSRPANGPAKMYVIPNCYLGNVPPKPERLPSGCDISRVQEIS